MPAIFKHIYGVLMHYGFLEKSLLINFRMRDLRMWNIRRCGITLDHGVATFGCETKNNVVDVTKIEREVVNCHTDEVFDMMKLNVFIWKHLVCNR